MFLIDIRVRYIILFTLIFLNFLHFTNTPLIYSDAIECLGIQCREFTLIMNLLSFTFLSAMMVSMGILNKLIFIPTYWFVPLIAFGYLAIILDWRNKKIVRPRPGKITPPPVEYIPKTRRLVIVMAILVLHLFLFITNYAAHLVPSDSDKFIDVVILSAFGSFKERPGACMCGWLSFFGLITGIVNIIFTEKFIPQIYNLPNSWRI